VNGTESHLGKGRSSCNAAGETAVTLALQTFSMVPLADFDWSLHQLVSSSRAHSVGAPLLRLQLFLAGAWLLRAAA